MDPRIEKFLEAAAFGVAGASTDRNKYGNKVLRCYLQNDRKVVPVNPKADEIEGIRCVDSVKSLPEEVKSLSIVTPPQITEKVVEEAVEKGMENVWMQPGSQSDEAVRLCRDNDINVIADGSCILVVLGYEDH
ncbi:MAG TPA: CoA-binding protein [Desulfuromonadales bacterium]|nr:CoA-binding protein [Desulfuromonadales bacterium]